MTTPTPARPCSSPDRPNPAGRPQSSWSSIVPHPTGTTSTTESNDNHPNNPRSSTTNGTTRRHVIGPRSHPGWQTLLDRLSDGDWHPTSDAIDIMTSTGLARRTAQNYLASASRRGWIRRKAGQVKLRDRHALEAALREATS